MSHQIAIILNKNHLIKMILNVLLLIVFVLNVFIQSDLGHFPASLRKLSHPAPVHFPDLLVTERALPHAVRKHKWAIHASFKTFSLTTGKVPIKVTLKQFIPTRLGNIF